MEMDTSSLASMSCKLPTPLENFEAYIKPLAKSSSTHLFHLATITSHYYEVEN